MSELQNPEIFRTILDTLQTGVCVVDREGKIVYWNQGATHAAGYMQHEVIGRPYEDIMQCRRDAQNTDEHPPACLFTRILHEGKATSVGVHLRHKRGHSVPMLMHMAPVRNQHGSILAIAASFDPRSFRSQREQDQHNLLPLAGLDIATGVANHNFTLFHLRENLASFTEYHIPFGIIRVRADGLEHFRATYGREAGDAISLVIAQTLSNSFRPSDFVGRWGEDEFLVILTNCGNVGLRSVYERTGKIVGSAEIRWWGKLLSLSTSMGCASVELGDTIELLLHRAEYPPDQAAATTGGSHGPRNRLKELS
ncbi:MAG TPA: diguanylate cyclase [Terriglobales bacterium]|nr:diguanylate cyclase [Terriglobales bacterium]